MLEGRRSQFIEEITAVEPVSSEAAATQVDSAIDTLVWYAGWSDKIFNVLNALEDKKSAVEMIQKVVL